MTGYMIYRSGWCQTYQLTNKETNSTTQLRVHEKLKKYFMINLKIKSRASNRAVFHYCHLSGSNLSFVLLLLLFYRLIRTINLPRNSSDQQRSVDSITFSEGFAHLRLW